VVGFIFIKRKIIGGENIEKLTSFTGQVIQLLRAQSIDPVEDENIFNNALSRINAKYLVLLENYTENLKTLDDKDWLKRFQQRVLRYDKLSRMNAPEQIIFNEIDLIEKAIDNKIKPEILISTEAESIPKLHEDLKKVKIFSAHEDIGNDLAKLLEFNIIHDGRKYDLKKINNFTLFNILGLKNRSEYIELILRLVNETTPAEMPLLEEFLEGNFVIINQVLDSYDKPKLFVIKNQPVLEKIILQYLDDYQYDEQKYDFFRKIRDGEFLEGLQFLIINHPSIDNVKILNKHISSSDKLFNHINWVLHKIPKGSNTRDQRRYLANYLLLVLLLGKINDHQEKMLKDLEEMRLGEENRMGMEGYAPAVIDSRNAQALLFIESIKNAKQKNILGLLEKIVNFLETKYDSREIENETALAFCELARLITAISSMLYYVDLSAVHQLLDNWKKETKNKHYIDKQKLRQIKEVIQANLLNYYLRELALDADDRQKLNEYVNLHPEAIEEGFILKIFNYYSFQDQTGKELVRTYLHKLANGLSEKEDFSSVELAQGLIFYMRDERKGRKGTNQYAWPEKVQYVQLRQEDLRRKFVNVWNDIKTHLRLNKLDEIEDMEIRGLLGEVEKKLYLGEKIELAVLNDWQEKIKVFLKKAFPVGLAEVLVNIEQLKKIQSQQDNEEEYRIELNITDSVRQLLEAGEFPYRTCQRITDETLFNQSGQPLRRAVHQNFYLLNATMRLGGEPSICARAILERTNVITQVNVGPTEQKKIDHAILVERRYVLGGINTLEFDLQILKMVARRKNIKYVILAGYTAEKNIAERFRKLVGVGYLPENVYRDTFRADSAYYAIDLNKLRKKWQVEPAYNPLLTDRPI
jgi:hypothetical protein